MRLQTISTLVFSVLLAATNTLRAEESGFLPDYEGLKFAPGEYGGKSILQPGAVDTLPLFEGIMIDQPEIFVAESSAYKGMKPDDARAIAEAFREALIANMVEKDRLVEEPGANVLYLRTAISDIHLKKKQRRLLSYTPAGRAAHAARSIATRNIMRKIDLVGATIEIEVLSADTGEHYSSFVMKLAPAGTGGTNEANWETMLSRFDALSKQFVCRIRSAKLAESEQSSCKILDSYQES